MGITQPGVGVDLRRRGARGRSDRDRPIDVGGFGPPANHAAGEAAPVVALTTLALHKPRGVVTTRRDERGRRTIYDLLPAGLPWLLPPGGSTPRPKGCLS